MGRPELSSFSQAYTVYAGREGVKDSRTLFENVVYCDFEKASQSKHFQSSLLVGRESVTKKVLCIRS